MCWTKSTAESSCTAAKSKAFATARFPSKKPTPESTEAKSGW
ncbi:UNVERIFIED_CONTAM: hypothetical protein GTU68_012811 [Idotea baltica]|nr:hypothetical protein [Idotea baltica]